MGKYFRPTGGLHAERPHSLRLQGRDPGRRGARSGKKRGGGDRTQARREENS